MGDNFKAKLAHLAGAVCTTADAVEYDSPPTDSIYAVGTRIQFADGTIVSAEFWRLIKSGGPLVSIFDHRQRYGLPAPIDAIRVLKETLVGETLLNASMHDVTGDLRFEFAGAIVLEIFNFTGFEIWEVTFPDGTGELSNYALEHSRTCRPPVA